MSSFRRDFTKAILRAQVPTIPESPFNFNNFPADPMSWVWPDFLASDFKFILAFEEIGFELGLFF